MAQVKAKLSRLRVAPRKARLVANLIKGMEVLAAEEQLRSLAKGSAEPILKLVKSAVANARNNSKIPQSESLFIKDIRIDEGPVFKRFMPRARGRATPIRKRTSQVLLVLDTR